MTNPGHRSGSDADDAPSKSEVLARSLAWGFGFLVAGAAFGFLLGGLFGAVVAGAFGFLGGFTISRPLIAGRRME